MDTEKIKQIALLAVANATTKKDKIVAEKLKQAGLDVNCVYLDDGLTPLIWAIKEKRTNLIKLFLECGASLDKEILVDGERVNALKYAKTKGEGYEDIVKILVDFRKEQTRIKKELIDAINNHAIKRIVELKDKINLDEPTKGELMTPLIRACELGQLDTVKILLLSGARTEIVDLMGATPLMWAGRYNGSSKVKVGKELLKAGADINAVDREFGSSPLIWWAVNAEEDVDSVKFLVDNGANVLWTDIDGKTASTHAYESSNVEVCHYLRKQEKVQAKFNDNIAKLNEKGKDRPSSSEKEQLYNFVVDKILSGAIYLSKSYAEILLPISIEHGDNDIAEKCRQAISKAGQEQKHIANKRFAAKRMAKIRGRLDPGED